MQKLASMTGRNYLIILLLICAVFGACAQLEATIPPTVVVNKSLRNEPLKESRFALLNGARIHYINYGSGSEAVVFIHGWTCDLNHWSRQLPEFAKRVRTIAIDLPGHGLSDKPQIEYSMDLFAMAVNTVLRDAKVSKAVLVGHSMGMLVAKQFYRRYSANTLAIVDVDCPLRPTWDDATMQRIIADFRGTNFRNALTEMFGAMMGPNLSEETKREIMSSSLETPQHVIVSALEAMADSSNWSDDKINVPVLVILADNPTYPATLKEVYRNIAPNIEIHTWKRVGHFLMMDRPTSFNKTVLSFVNKNSLFRNVSRYRGGSD
jgi:pimeloyl-ACP methyl ester carboxylesterase